MVFKKNHFKRFCLQNLDIEIKASISLHTWLLHPCINPKYNSNLLSALNIVNVTCELPMQDKDGCIQSFMYIKAETYIYHVDCNKTF